VVTGGTGNWGVVFAGAVTGVIGVNGLKLTKLVKSHIAIEMMMCELFINFGSKCIS